MNELPNPLTPADCNLQDFQYMPLDVLRLRDSDLAARTTGEEFRCAVLLWCASWHQVPAGSLPDDDVNLANYAGFGRSTDEWKKHRDGALRGWIKCADGRLYHPVVAEKANEAWHAKHKLAYDKLAERMRKRNKARTEKGLVPLEIPPFEQWIDIGLPTERILFPSEFSSPSSGTPPKIPPENGLKGEERRGEERKGEVNTGGSVITPGKPAHGASDDSTPKDAAEWQRYFRERHGVELDATSVHDRKKAWPLFTAWVKAGVSIAQMDAAIAKAQDEATETIVFLPAYVDRVLASLSRPTPQPRINPDDHRRAISDANAAAFLAGTSADPNVIDMEH